VSLLYIKQKVKGKSRLVACQAGAVEGTSVALPMVIPSDRRRCVVIATLRPSYNREREPVHRGRSGTCVENLAPAEFRTRADYLVARSYTGCASPVALMQLMRLKKNLHLQFLYSFCVTCTA